jgi:hypothetical protein
MSRRRKEPDTMVCARATAPTMAPGSSFGRFCARCFTRLMIAPTGMAKLAEHPRIETICAQCFFDSSDPLEEILLCAEPEYVLQEILGATRNTYLDRN